MSKRSPKLSTSPSRGTFGSKGSGDLFEEYIKHIQAQESDPIWAENNLEYDLRTADWILTKVRGSEVYAQNLYAALCNNTFQKIRLNNTEDNVADVLRKGYPQWHCSWRHAGGIVADMREKGDYVDWYCSGIQEPIDNKQLEEMSENHRLYYQEVASHFVSESIIVDEIRQDLEKLSWIVIKDE